MANNTIIEFARGNINNLSYQQGTLKSDYFNRPTSIFSIRAINTYIAEKGLQSITPSQKIDLANRVRKGCNSNCQEKDQFQKVFSKEVTPEMIVQCLRREEYDLVLFCLKKQHIDLTVPLLHWTDRKGVWTKRDCGFGFKMLPYVAQGQVSEYLKKLDAKVGANKVFLSLHKLSRVARACKKDKSLGDLSKKLVHYIIQLDPVELPLKEELLQCVNRMNQLPVFLKTAQAVHLVTYFNDLIEAFIEKGEQEQVLRNLIFLSELNDKVCILKIFLDAVLDYPSDARTEKVLYWLSQAQGVNFVDYIDSPLIEKKIKENRHPILHILANIRQLPMVRMTQALQKFNDYTIENNTKQSILEVVLIHRRFDIAKQLIEKGARLPNNKSYFDFDPSGDFVRYLHTGGMLGVMGQEDRVKLVTVCHPSLYAEVKALFPEMDLQGLDMGTLHLRSHYLGEVRHPEVQVKIDEGLQALDNTFQQAPPSQEITTLFLSIATFSSVAFLELKNKCPIIYRKLDKTLILDEIIKFNKSINIRLVRELVRDGAVLTPRRIVDLCLRHDYQKGFLGELMRGVPTTRLIKKESGISATYPYVTLEFLEDLFDLFAVNMHLPLLGFMVYMINLRTQINGLDILFELINRKKHSQHFRRFFFNPDKKSPLTKLNSYNFSRLRKEHIDHLVALGSYSAIFSTFEFLDKLLLNNRYDLYIYYIEADRTLFNRGNSRVSNGLIYSSIGEVIHNRHHMNRNRVVVYLGLDGLFECLRNNIRSSVDEIALFDAIQQEGSGNNVEKMTQLTKEDIEPFKPYLDCRDHRGNTPLLESAYMGKSRYILYLLEMGSTLFVKSNRNLNFFHLFFRDFSLNKTEVLKFIYRNGINCSFLLLEDSKYGTPFQRVLKHGNREEFELVLKIFFFNNPAIPILRQLLLDTARLNPSFLQLLMSYLPAGVLAALSVEEAKLVYGRGLAVSNQKQIFTAEMLLEVSPNTLFEIALLDKEEGVVLYFIEKELVSLEEHKPSLRKCSVNKLLGLHHSTRGRQPLLDVANEKIRDEIRFVDELKAYSLLKKNVDTKFLYDVEQRRVKGIDGIEDLVSYLYVFNPEFYQLPVIENKLPPHEEPARYKAFLQLFDLVVPARFETREEEAPFRKVSRDVLRKRLVSLFRFIERQTPYPGTEEPGFYPDFANSLSHIYDYQEKLSDKGVVLQVVVDLAKGGPEPDGHCGTRWDSFARYYVNHLGPHKISPTGLQEWILYALNQFRVGCAERLVDKFKYTESLIPHLRRAIHYFLNEQKIPLYNVGKLVDDPLGDAFPPEEALQTFLLHHTTGGAYRVIRDLIHQLLSEDERDWISSAVKEDHQRFLGPDFTCEHKRAEILPVIRTYKDKGFGVLLTQLMNRFSFMVEENDYNRFMLNELTADQFIFRLIKMREKHLAFLKLVELDKEGELRYFDLGGTEVPEGTKDAVIHYHRILPIFLLTHSLKILLEK